MCESAVELMKKKWKCQDGKMSSSPKPLVDAERNIGYTLTYRFPLHKKSME
jgi:hypothetical protein